MKYVSVSRYPQVEFWGQSPNWVLSLVHVTTQRQMLTPRRFEKKSTWNSRSQSQKKKKLSGTGIENFMSIFFRNVSGWAFDVGRLHAPNSKTHFKDWPQNPIYGYLDTLTYFVFSLQAQVIVLWNIPETKFWADLKIMKFQLEAKTWNM